MFLLFSYLLFSYLLLKKIVYIYFSFLLSFTLIFFYPFSILIIRRKIRVNFINFFFRFKLALLFVESGKGAYLR